MITTRETLKKTSTSEAPTEKKESGIEGILRDPLVQPVGDDQLRVTYHWEASGDRHTYLHLLLRKSLEDPFGTVQANLDSEDIKGQGDALWSFATHQIQDISNHGNFPVYHEVNVNDYSRRLPEADPRYLHLDENRYVGIYNPEPQDPALKTYHSERV